MVRKYGCVTERTLPMDGTLSSLTGSIMELSTTYFVGLVVGGDQ